jgi:CheY-like chemotaxis protein/anti-sigma regulatory factor (Ser/Thr protein kinase)
MRDLVQGAHATFNALASSKGLGFTLCISPEAEGCYLGDATRIRQIIYNLISNALKFTSAGHVEVSVERPNGPLLVQVVDTGIGIPADQAPHLFEAFAQGDSSTTRRYGGTGLGLAVCRNLASKMGGEILVRSAPGAGSCFTLVLDLARVAVEPPGAVSQSDLSAEPGPSFARRIRVLAAEDNAVNQLVLRTLLGQAAVDPVIVASGLEAVEAWSREVWDVVLMDVHMPEMDGVSATREIRARESAAACGRTPILMLTADVMSHNLSEYLLAGADGIVAKPINAAALFAELEKALSANEAASRAENAA